MGFCEVGGENGWMTMGKRFERGGGIMAYIRG